MNISENLKPWLTKKPVIGLILGVLVAAVGVSFLLPADTPTEETNESEKSVVSLTTASAYTGQESLSVIGSVRAFSEAKVTTEVSGRVTSVNVSLGETVSAGTVIATLENSSQRAAVLQAEGSYEAALAGAAQNEVGTDEAQNSLRSAQNSAISALQSAYNTSYDTVVNSIDTFFSNPTGNIPGLRIAGKGYTSNLNDTREDYQSLLPAWQQRVNNLTTNSDLEAEIEYASQNVQKTINFVETFLAVFDSQGSDSRYSEEELVTFNSNFNQLRSALNNEQSNLNSAASALESAADQVRRAELSASGGVSSASDAQVKQALGSLRAAQANLAKTILRTPISGTVNSISVRPGDFVSSFSQIALVANNNALEVVTYISDSERDLIKEGDEVLIEGQYEGVVTQIAPALDAETRKTEVRIGTEGDGISNGDTVRITKQLESDSSTMQTILVPLTAVKFDRENGSVFVLKNNVLEAKEVVLGNVRGNSIEIESGLEPTDEFVVDSRGLIAGEKVTINN